MKIPSGRQYPPVRRAGRSACFGLMGLLLALLPDAGRTHTLAKSTRSRSFLDTSLVSSSQPSNLPNSEASEGVLVEGLFAPLASLAPYSEPTPLPQRSFQQGSTLNLRLKLTSQGRPWINFEGPPPYLSGLRKTRDNIDQPAIITTVVGGGPNNLPAVAANLDRPISVASDGKGNYYIGVGEHVAGERVAQHRVFKVDPAGILTVLAGDGFPGFSGDGGPATRARIDWPFGLAADHDGNVYIATRNRIRRVDSASGIITTVVGDGVAGFSGDGGPGREARIRNPLALTTDGAGNLYIADSGNGRIRRLDARTGIISTIAGNGLSGRGGDGGPAIEAAIGAGGVAVDKWGNVFISEGAYVRRVDAATGIITTIAGNGEVFLYDLPRPATDAGLGGRHYLSGVVVDEYGDLYLTYMDNDCGCSYYLLRIDAATGLLDILPWWFLSTDDLTIEGGNQVAAAGGGWLITTDNRSRRVQLVNPRTGCSLGLAGNGVAGCSTQSGIPGTDASIHRPNQLATDGLDNVYFTDDCGVHRLDQESGRIETLVGTGGQGIVVDRRGSLYYSDARANKVFEVDLTTRMQRPYAGSGVRGYDGDGGPATSSKLSHPGDLGVNARGDLFILDRINEVVRKVDVQTGLISSVAGGGSSEGDGVPATGIALGYSAALVVDPIGNFFLGQPGSIRRVDAQTNIIRRVVGTGQRGYSGDGGPAVDAQIDYAYGMAVSDEGDLVIADYEASRVRKVDGHTGIISLVAGIGARDRYEGEGGPAAEARLPTPVGVTTDSSGNVYISEGAGPGMQAPFEANAIRRVHGNGRPLDLQSLDLVSGSRNTRSLALRPTGPGQWSIEISTRDLEPGSYLLTIELPRGPAYRLPGDQRLPGGERRLTAAFRLR